MRLTGHSLSCLVGRAEMGRVMMKSFFFPFVVACISSVKSVRFGRGIFVLREVCVPQKNAEVMIGSMDLDDALASSDR